MPFCEEKGLYQLLVILFSYSLNNELNIKIELK